jgi:hypothetical protein
MPETMTIAEAAEWLETNEQEIARLIAAGLPVDDAGRVSPHAAARWLEISGFGEVQGAHVVDTLADVAAHFGVKPYTVRDWRRDRMPGSRGAWDLRAIAQWRRSRRKKPEPDPLMSGPTSPALERYRAARAALVELDLARRRGELIDRDQWQQFMLHAAGLIRSAGEGLLKHFGPEAHAILDDALLALEGETKRFFSTDNP